MPYIKTVEELKKLPALSNAETAKVAVVRPTTHFAIMTDDNPDMKRTLEAQVLFVKEELKKIQPPLTGKQLDKAIANLQSELQNKLSKEAEIQQKHLIAAMKKQGIPVRTILEDKGKLETSEFDYYTDQIFATDTGQYYDNNGQLSFIPANFKNQQRQGEERLATQQAINLGAAVKPLVSKNGKQLIFEGGDIRQMPGKKLFFIGQGHRSAAKTGELIATLTDYVVLPIKLLNEQFYHLDCCFLPLPNNAAVIYEGDYQLNEMHERILDENTGWPKLIPGSETMTAESRALIRTLYSPDQLILITKKEALAFATNAALLQSSSDSRFKLFVNGNRTQVENEDKAIDSHQLSFKAKHVEEMITATKGSMDIIEIPYNIMHGSGGSVRCTVQEMACTETAIKPDKNNRYNFSDAVDRLENALNQRPIQRRNHFFGNPQALLSKKAHETSSIISCRK